MENIGVSPHLGSSRSPSSRIITAKTEQSQISQQKNLINYVSNFEVINIRRRRADLRVLCAEVRLCRESN